MPLCKGQEIADLDPALDKSKRVAEGWALQQALLGDYKLCIGRPYPCFNYPLLLKVPMLNYIVWNKVSELSFMRLQIRQHCEIAVVGQIATPPFESVLLNFQCATELSGIIAIQTYKVLS